MHTRSRRLVPAVLIPILAVALAACGPDASTPDPITATPTMAGPTTAATTAATTAPDPASQTETDWGTIWDGVPEGFPRFPGSTSADDATGSQASDRYVVADGDATEIAAWLQTSMENATYSTEGLSGPFEDGSFVLDSVGEAGCRIQTTVAPLGGMILVTVLYGADCPAA
ncbi:hypothetical protein BH20CHL7_BH20CHL7_13910 [soil metagenome]